MHKNDNTNRVLKYTVYLVRAQRYDIFSSSMFLRRAVYQAWLVT